MVRSLVEGWPAAARDAGSAWHDLSRAPISGAAELGGDKAAARDRMVSDAAVLLARAPVAPAVAAASLRSLAQLAADAFARGGERAWSRLYVALERVVASGPSDASPAFARLSAFLAENADLAEPAAR